MATTREDSRASHTPSDHSSRPTDSRGYLDLGMVAQPVIPAHGINPQEGRMQSGSVPQAQRQASQATQQQQPPLAPAAAAAMAASEPGQDVSIFDLSDFSASASPEKTDMKPDSRGKATSSTI